MHYFNKLSFFENNPIDIAELKGDSRIIFFTRNRDLQIQMSMEALKEGFKNFMIVLDTLEGENYENPDDRFIVQGPSSSPGSRFQSTQHP